MKKNKAYKFRIYPNESQKELLAKTFGCSRLVFNYYLDKKQKLYEESKRTMSLTDCIKDLVNLKKEKEFLYEVDSISLQQSIRHLDTAFSNFFKNKEVGYPKFKSKKDHNYSYSTVNVNNNIKIIDNRHITLPKIGIIYSKIHRDIPSSYILKSSTISKSSSEKYYISILFEYEEYVKEKEINKIVSLDYSQSNLYISSDKYLETKQDYLRYYEKNIDRIKYLSRRLSNCKVGSNRYNKMRIKINKLYEHISNKRKDFLNKESSLIAKKYDLVIIEDLNMLEMSQNKEYELSKRISDNSWHMFTSMLKYKLEDKGGKLLKVDKYYPSSKLCSNCGYYNKDLTLSNRYWICPYCGLRHNRDKNATYNLIKEGLRLLDLNPTI